MVVIDKSVPEQVLKNWVVDYYFHYVTKDRENWDAMIIIGKVYGTSFGMSYMHARIFFYAMPSKNFEGVLDFDGKRWMDGVELLKEFNFLFQGDYQASNRWGKSNFREVFRNIFRKRSKWFAAVAASENLVPDCWILVWNERE